MTEYLTLGLLLLVQIVVEVFQGVGHHEIHGIIEVIEFLVVFVIGVLLGLLPAVFHTIGRYIALFLVDDILALFAVSFTHALLHLL